MKLCHHTSFRRLKQTCNDTHYWVNIVLDSQIGFTFWLMSSLSIPQMKKLHFVNYNFVKTNDCDLGKEIFYFNWKNVFFPLAIKAFGYLHKQIDDIFHHSTNLAWLAKCIKWLLLLCSYKFYK
jgi:hypothetical protein